MAALAISLVLTPARTTRSAEPAGDSRRVGKGSSDDDPSQTNTDRKKGHEITGTTPDELIGQIVTASMNNNLIIKWDMKWSYKVLEAADMCTAYKVSATPKIQQPARRLAWLDSVLATDELRTKWKHYIKALEDHNQGHIDIAKYAAYDIKVALANMTAKDCAQLKKDTDAKANEIIQNYRQQDDEYDRITGNDELHTGADVYLLK